MLWSLRSCGGVTSVTAAFLALLALPASAGPNPNVAIVLHAHPHSETNVCSTPQTSLGLDCGLVPPVTAVSPGQEVDVYVYLHGYTDVEACQMAFQWHSSWSFVEWHGPCQSRELDVATPTATNPNLIAAFDVVTGGTLKPLGWLTIVAGTTGTEFKVVETWATGGTAVLSTTQVFDQVLVTNRGVIRVGSPGVNACSGQGGSDAVFIDQ